MAIEIIRGRRKFRSFLVYDLEWIPGSLQVRMVGVYDETESQCRYRHYTTVDQFLSAELTSENRGRWFFAHAGGLADVQFVLEAVVRNPRFRAYTVKASFSGSSAIIVKITDGKNAWTFIDSYWLLRDKLSKIAKSIGMEKSGPANEDDEEAIREWYANQPMEDLIPYNENDCRILWKAIRLFELTLLEYGGQLQTTLASSAMHLFRRKYLQQGIPTHASVNDKARLSYTASRVEVFREHMDPPGYYFDINSSFPFAMTQPCPGELIGVSRSMPLGSDFPFLADVEVEIPDAYLTPAPIRLGGRIFFPIGKWRSWYTNVDIELIVKEGGRIRRVYEVLKFEPFHDLSSYAKDIYERRRRTTDPVEKYVLKLLLNSLYGKFAESAEKSAIHVNPSAATLRRLSADDMLFPGVWEETLTVPVPHMWVPISAHITALARRTLYDFLCMTRRFYYCDTDGFATKDNFQTTDALGGLKLEMTIDKIGSFLQPKLYRLDDKVKAKGFSLGWEEGKPKKISKAIELFESLKDGKSLTVTRMSRIKENLIRASRVGESSPKPHEGPIIKRLSNTSIKKRCFNEEGISRPWTVKELYAKGLKP